MKTQELQITPALIKSAAIVECPACGHKLFENAMIMKKISAILSPSGKEEMVPLAVIVCKKCGKVPAWIDTEDIIPADIKTSTITLTV